MRIIKPSFEILEQEDLYKHIELCGRVCYKSEDKISGESAQRFVNNLIKSEHTSVLEHGTVYLATGDLYLDTGKISPHKKYENNNYSSVEMEITSYAPRYHITTNYRVLVENDWLDDLQYAIPPTKFHDKRVTVKFICDRGILQEFRTHRVFAKDDDDNWICDVGNFSASAESTRYCNYSKDKFGKEIAFIAPNWGNLDDYEYANLYQWDVRGELKAEEVWSQAMSQSEQHYLRLLKKGWTPQQARSVLPNSLKTELIMTGFVSDWEHFFELRCAENAHPQARELAIPLRKEFIRRGYING